MNENTTRKPKRPRDINQLAAQIVAEAVGDAEPEVIEESHASKIARLGGLSGGKARAKKLTDEERKEIAIKAADARWHK